MRLEIDHPGLECGDVRDRGIFFLYAAVVFEGTNGGHKHYGVRRQAGVSAFYVEELFSTKIGAETRFRDDIVCHFKREFGRTNRVTAVSNVCKRSAVNKTGSVFKRLDKVWFDGILEKGGHRPDGFQIPCIQRSSFPAVTENDISQTNFQIVNIVCKTEDSHHFTCDRDHKVVLTRNAVGLPAESDDDVSKSTVVHIQTAFEDDAPGINVESISLLDMVIDHSTQEVVCAGDGVEVSGKVEIDVFHRDNLRVSSAGSSAFDAEYGTEGWFAKCNDCLFTDLGHRLTKTDCCRGLTLAGRRRIDGRDQDQFAVWFISQTFFQRIGKFGFV